jgi:hypothetical protein
MRCQALSFRKADADEACSPRPRSRSGCGQLLVVKSKLPTLCFIVVHGKTVRFFSLRFNRVRRLSAQARGASFVGCAIVLQSRNFDRSTTKRASDPSEGVRGIHPPAFGIGVTNSRHHSRNMRLRLPSSNGISSSIATRLTRVELDSNARRASNRGGQRPTRLERVGRPRTARPAVMGIETRRARPELRGAQEVRLSYLSPPRPPSPRER